MKTKANAVKRYAAFRKLIAQPQYSRCYRLKFYDGYKQGVSVKLCGLKDRCRGHDLLVKATKLADRVTAPKFFRSYTGYYYQGIRFFFAVGKNRLSVGNRN